jgi:radical SAM superfamily enzyme YgiQ (UPF0313 family)
MRIGFVHCLYESLGIEYLSAYLKNEGNDVRLFFDPLLFKNYLINNSVLDKWFSYRKHLIDSIVKDRPDVVAFSVLSDNYAWCCDLAEEIKKRINTIIVFGGIHATAVPARVLNQDFVNFVICGEGEAAMLELIDSLKKGRSTDSINNLGYRKNSKTVINKIRPPIENLDSVPFPDKDLFFNEYNEIVNEAYMIITSRGCLYKCSYCCENLMDKIYGKYYRRRSPNNVINELIWAKARYKIKRVNFQDSVFTHDHVWLEDFLTKYKELVGLPFFCFIYPSRNIEKKLIDNLIESGCVTVNMGVQTFDPEVRKNIYLRYESNDDILRSISVIKKTNLYLYLDFVIFPLQTESELLETLKFCSRTGADFIAIAWLVFYPGTEIINISKDLGILSDADVESIEEGRNYVPYFDKKSRNVKVNSKICNLIFISGNIPLSLIKLIIRFKLYYYMPSGNLFLPLLMIVGLLKQLFRKKTPFSYRQVFSYFGKYYYVYMRKKLFSMNHRAENKIDNPDAYRFCA